MPIENERKFVLDDDGTLERTLAATPGVDAQLPAPGLSRRLGPAHPLDRSRRPDASRLHLQAAGRRPDGRDRDRDQRRSTSSGCGRIRRETLQKARYSWGDGRFHWDVDFFKTDDGRTYFALAEVEMPEDRHGAAAAAGRPGARTCCCWRRRGDPRFTSKRLADRGHAERLLADVREKGEASHEDRAHRQPFDQGAVHLRRHVDRLRRAHWTTNNILLVQGRDRHRHRRLGRGVLLRLHRCGARRRCIDMVAPIAIGRDARDIARLSLRPAAGAASVRPLRHHHLRLVGPRHRAVGHRRQGGQPAAASAAGRRRPRQRCRPMPAC